MKILLTLAFGLTGLLMIDTASSQNSSQPTYAERLKQTRQIYRSRPRRLDEPLRYENISDREVQEIVSVAADVFPGFIINISGVTTGCPCQDGPQCTSQVWVVAHQEERTRGLMLSRIDQQWIIGALQQWWLALDQLRARMRHVLRDREPGFGGSYRDLLEEQNALQDAFPVCNDEHSQT